MIPYANFRPEDALKIGLLDELVDDNEECLQRATQMVINFNESLMPSSVVDAKLQSREKILNYFHDHRDEELDNFIKYIQGDEIQQVLQNYVKSLKKK